MRNPLGMTIFYRAMGARGAFVGSEPWPEGVHARLQVGGSGRLGKEGPSRVETLPP